jgi:ATP-binding cassette subfamily C (CFTR/MRP) protein 2
LCANLQVASDWSILDIDVAYCFGFSASASMNALSILVVTCLVIWPILFIIFPMVYINRLLQNYYLTSAREIMRINGTTKAPVVHHFGEAIAGAVTIRAFKRENMFARKNLELIDANASPFFHSIAATEWLIQRLEILSAVVLSASALLIVFLPEGQIDPGFAGLVITYGLSLNVSQVFSVQHQCNLANVIISVERIKQYMNLPSEAPAVIMDERPPVQWPSTGKVELKNLQVCCCPFFLTNISSLHNQQFLLN